MSRTRLLLFVLGLFTICLIASTNRPIGRLDQTVSNVTPRTLPCTIDSYVQNPNEGEMNLSGHDTLLMEDYECNLTTKIIAEDYAVIVVRNAMLTLSPSDGTGISFVLKGQSGLLVINSTINFTRLTFGDCQIVLQDEAEANFTTATLAGWGYIIGRDASAVYVEKSNIGSGVAGLNSPGVATYGTSKVKVEDSSVDGVYVWENSTASIQGSDVGIVRTTYAELGKIAINITDSTVGTFETYVVSEQLAGTAVIRIINSTVIYAAYIHLNSTAWIENSSVAMITATGNATVWLIKSSVGQISLEGEARVFLGWDLPLFGFVWMPYSLIPIIQAGNITAMVIGVAAVSYAIWRKRKERED
jgi:hypothetical protein